MEADMTAFFHHPVAGATLAAFLTLGVSASADTAGTSTSNLPPPHPIGGLSPVGGAGTPCVTPGSYMDAFKENKPPAGGKTIALTGGIEQAFSNAWRRHEGLEPISVALVVGYAYANPRDDNIMVDTIEFGTDGCAVSRTLLSGDAWLALIRAASGIAA
jgi:hypothetical protein